MKVYKYRNYEREADSLLDYMATKGNINEQEVDLYVNALAILEYDRFVSWEYVGTDKVYYLTDRGMEAWKNGGYLSLIEYLDWNQKEKWISGFLYFMILCFVFSIIALNIKLSICFGVLCSVLFLYCRKRDVKYKQWIDSAYKWDIKIAD